MLPFPPAAYSAVVQAHPYTLPPAHPPYLKVSACPAYNPGSAFLLSAGDTSTVSRKIQRTPQEKQFPIPQNTGYLLRIRHRGKA